MEISKLQPVITHSFKTSNGKVVRDYLPRTGTFVTRSYDEADQLISKEVIIGPLNKLYGYINYFKTIFENGEATTLTEVRKYGASFLKKNLGPKAQDI